MVSARRSALRYGAESVDAAGRRDRGARSQGSCGGVASVAGRRGAGGTCLVQAGHRSPQTPIYKLRRGNATIPQQAAFFRSTLWKMVGPLDSSFYYAMDYDLWIRISSVSPIDYYPRLWANFRLQNSSKSMQEAHRCWPEIIRIHFRDGGSVFSILYAKYLLRRVLEPIMPLRMAFWKWKFVIENRLRRTL